LPHVHATKKSTFKLDKSRTVHMIEEGDDNMVDAVAHVKRWLEDKGYTDLTP
jgi:hypothetical protein